MVDWSSSLQLVNAALDVSDHAIGFKLFRLLYGALLSLVMLGYVGIASAVWGEQSIWKRAGFATHRLRPFGLFDLLPEPVAGLGAIVASQFEQTKGLLRLAPVQAVQALEGAMVSDAASPPPQPAMSRN